MNVFVTMFTEQQAVHRSYTQTVHKRTARHGHVGKERVVYSPRILNFGTQQKRVIKTSRPWETFGSHGVA
jgi:hypothetical protein